MGEIISIFHLDLKLIIAQLVNFGIVVFVLWYFALKPLSQKMNDRTEKIDKSLKDAEQITANLKASEAEKQEIIKAARVQAEKLINDSKVLIEQDKKETVEKTKAEVKKIVEQSRQQLAAEKQKMFDDLKTEMVSLVQLSTAKVLSKTVDKKIDNELIKDTLKEAK